MNISLRKASALQNSINEVIKSINLTTEVAINEFQNSETTVADTLVKFKADLVRRDSLVSALYEIRKAVGVANNANGVNMRLADIAHLEKQIQSYAVLAGKEVRDSWEVINGKLDKIRNRKDEGRASLYGYNDTVTTSVLDAADIKAYKDLVAEAKKAKQKLQDEVLELNVRSEITLSDRTSQTLSSERLL
jgi:hypothetical protein